jgi:hypothetical protein
VVTSGVASVVTSGVASVVTSGVASVVTSGVVVSPPIPPSLSGVASGVVVSPPIPPSPSATASGVPVSPPPVSPELSAATSASTTLLPLPGLLHAPAPSAKSATTDTNPTDLRKLERIAMRRPPTEKTSGAYTFRPAVVSSVDRGVCQPRAHPR